MRYLLKIINSILFCLTVCIAENLPAQISDLEFEHFSTQQGFAQRSVFSVLQDSLGFMWFGTADGLYRYDGYNFHQYKHIPVDPTSLSHNVVISLYEDRSGALWIGTEGGGLNKFDRDKEIFTRYQYDPTEPFCLSNNTVSSIFEDRSGNLWFGTNGGGLNKLTSGENGLVPLRFIHYTHNPQDKSSISSDMVGSIHEDKSGDLWIGTEEGLNKLDPSPDDKVSSEFIHYKHDPADFTSLSSNIIISILEDKSGVFWIGTIGGGLNKLIPEERKKRKPAFVHFVHNPKDGISLSSNAVSSVFEDHSGNIWIGTLGGGLNKFDRSKEAFTHYTFDPHDPKGLNGNWVYTIYQDRSGILWIGTMPGGLNKLDPRKKKFDHYRHDPYNSASLSGNRVFSICEDSNRNLWIGTFHAGFNKLTNQDDANSPPYFLHYEHDPADPNSLSNNSVFSMLEDRSGNLWIGTFGGGLNKLVPEEQEKEHPAFIHFKNNPADAHSLSDDVIRAIYEDNDGILWIGTENGLNKYVTGDNTSASALFTRYLNNPHDPASLSNNTVWSILRDGQGILWIGTSGGLNRLNSEDTDNSSPGFIHYTHDSSEASSLSNNEVSVIYEDNRGILWIGTSGGGLNKFDRQTEKFTRLDETDGLPNNAISGILEDDQGNLWLSTRKGLSRFNPTTKMFRNYLAEDGLIGDEFQQGAYFKSKAGEMFFGSTDGFIRFHPDSIIDNTIIPSIVITDFLLSNNSVPVGFDRSTNRSVLKQSLTGTKLIELNYYDKIISFEFAALDFHLPGKNRYAYRLEGFDQGWRYTKANMRFATYTNLDPGAYTFMVKGSNNDGIWNEAGTSLRIIITPPWWATWWAYMLYGLSIIGLLLSIRRYELNRLNWKNQFKLEEVKLKERTEIDRMKSRFFANISHEFRTPLTLILGPVEKIIRESSGEEIEKNSNLIKSNAKRLLVLINQLLDLSKLESGKLNLKTTKANLISFIKGITRSFESLAERKNITLEVKADKEVIELYIDRDKLTKIMTNLLSNAFKFTPENGQITVTINKSDHNLVDIGVRDSGIGIPVEEQSKLFDRFYQVDSSFIKEHEGTGIGLALTKELVELHHGTIRVSSKPGEGAEFTVRLPLGRDHLKDMEIIDQAEIENDVVHDGVEHQSEITLNNDSPKISGKENETDEDKNILLIVEDNQDVRDFIKDSIGADFQIEEASNGEMGVDKAQEIIPDIIISDVMMPKKDGIQLTKILKNDKNTSHIPIILLTAKSEQESKLDGLETGADDYLTKPFDTRELRIRIKNLLNIRKNLQEKYSKGILLGKRSKKKLSDLEEQFMNRVIEVINNHLDQEDFSIEAFDRELGMGRVQIFRKLKALTGKSPSRYIRTIRLARARQMIEEKSGNISEIAYAVGFGSPAYFSKCFKEEFGYLPSDLANY